MQKLANADELTKALLAAENRRTEAVDNLLKLLREVADGVKRIEEAPPLLAEKMFRAAMAKAGTERTNS